MRAAQVRTTHPTPGRTVAVDFNYAESVVTERGFQHSRSSAQIRPQPAGTTNVLQTAHGHWILRPEQDLSLVSEKASLHAYQLRTSQCGVAPHVEEITFQRKYSEFVGIGAAAAVATTGDYYMIKRIAAGDTWNQVVVSGPAPPTLPTAHYPLDRVMVGPTIGPLPEANTGWLFKVRVPGAAGQTPDFFASIMFGGSQAGTDPNGYGLYYLAFAGDGLALLYEFIEGAWSLVARWRWGSPADTPILMLVCRILPFGSRWIEFSTFNAGLYSRTLDVITTAAMHALRANLQESEANGVFAYTATNRDRLADVLRDEFGAFPIVGQGMVAVDIRRDLRAMWQVSRIVYNELGTLDDEAIQIPYGYGDAHILTLTPAGETAEQGGTTAGIIGSAVQNADGTALTPATEDYTLGGVTHTGPTALTGWNPPGGANMCRAHFQFSNVQSAGARYQTPVLTGYTVQRRPHIQTVTPSAFTPATVTEVSITGPGVEPDQESAFVAIEDLTAAVATLRTHGKQPVRISTSYPGQGAEPNAILFEGYVGRATGKRKGKTGKTFPSADWHRYECELLGKWDRLAATYFHERFDFGNADTSPSGPSTDPTNPAWLVTDIARVLLEHSGFQDSQVDIPVSTMRLFHGAKDTKTDLFTPTLGTWIADYLKRLSADWLGRFFCWDANAGSSGMFRTLFPPSGAAPGAVWTFTTASPGSMKLAHLAASYGASTSPVLNMLDEYVVAPEFSVLTVRGGATTRPDGVTTVPQHTFRNPTSFNAPTHPATADNTSLDYLPRVHEMIHHDPSLPNMNAVKFVGRLLMQRAGSGQRWRSFIAETVLLNAADFEPLIYTTRLKRPLLVGDVVMMQPEGTRWVIWTNNPIFKRSGLQLSHYEARLYRESMAWG